MRTLNPKEEEEEDYETSSSISDMLPSTLFVGLGVVDVKEIGTDFPVALQVLEQVELVATLMLQMNIRSQVA